MVDCLTDNTKRTVADVRHAFTKHGGNLGTDGYVAFLFKHCAQFVLAPGADEELIMEVGLSGGAEDVISDADDSVEVIASPNDFESLKSIFEQSGLEPEVAEVTYKPTILNALEGEEAEKMQKLLDALEALDDVQDVYTTADYEV